MNAIDSQDSTALFLELVKLILADESVENDPGADIFKWEEMFSLLQQHALLGLSVHLLKAIPDLPDDFKQQWKTSIYAIQGHNVQLKNEQKIILQSLHDNEIPTVVLKGTSAADFYPRPQERTLGDIDLLVLPKDYENTCRVLKQNGWMDYTGEEEEEKGRHRSYQKHGIVLELHASFATLADEEKANIFDNLLFDNICLERTVLPDDLNGLVLLEHIAQHLNKGIGLRQIIDWMMFVNCCLDDQAWDNGFRALTQRVGMEDMATTVTRMCQIYLGLREDITWCQSADQADCKILMDYILQCGNFGRNRDVFQSEFIRDIPTIRHPIKLIRHLQEHGERSWAALDKHPFLRPFAWIYQIFRYLSTARRNKLSLWSTKKAYDVGQERKDLFQRFGIPM